LLYQSVIESASLIVMALPERVFCIAQDDSGKVFPVVKRRRASRDRLLARPICKDWVAKFGPFKTGA
jgi:hypothetical protein